MNNTTNAGRHGSGGKLARPGSIRSGQAEPGGNKVKTASRPAMRPAPPVLTDQARTSNDAQRKIMRPPMPFADAQQGSLKKVPTHPAYRSTGNPKELNYEISGRHSIHNGTKMSADMMAAVGYGPNDTMSNESIISGRPTQNNRRQAGKPGSRNSNTSASENARMRQGR